VVPPRRLDAEPVPYPPNGQGDASVDLVIVVDPLGAVRDVMVRQGAPFFADAAAAAVKTWQFAPATRDETPIAARIAVTVTFHAPPQPHVLPTHPMPPSEPQHPREQTTLARGAPEPAEPIDVSVKGEREELGTNHIPRTEAQLVPGAFGDPFRIVEALPGMAPYFSGLPYYYVRGSPPETVGYSIDGIRVPLLFHVGAGPSTIAAPLVDSVDLFSGGYPARYGRYAGAIIAGETTPPEEGRAHGEAGARVFDAHAFVETPFDNGRGTVLAAGRYSYTDLLTSLIVPDYKVGYWDYQLRLSHRVADKDTVSLFVFGSHDELAYKQSPTFHIEYHRVDLRYDHPLRDGHVRVAGTFSYDDTLTALQTDTGAGASAALKGPGGRVRTEVEQRVSSGALVRAGADIGVTRFSVDDYEGLVRPPHTDVEGGVYADVVWRPTERVELVPGFRFDGYQTRNQTAWAPQPRLSTKVRLLPNLLWISALGTAHQEPTEEVFIPSKVPDPIVSSSGGDSYQFSEAIEVRLPSSMRLRATGFYSRLVARQLSREDRSEGLEVFLRRDFTRRLGGFVSYTLSRSDTIAGTQTFRSVWDRTHLLSVVLGYDLGSNWRIGGRFFFESGRLYQAVCQDCAGPPSTATGNLPAFYRLAARVEKKWFFSGEKWLGATLECFNVFDKPEPIFADYSARQGVIIRTQSPIILPSIGLEGGF
jgi:TonB family protein